MDANDPRRDLDKFTAALVEQMRGQIHATAAHLLSSNAEIALSQIEILRKNSIHYLKNVEFELWSDVARVSPTDLREEEILKIMRITIAALEETYGQLREGVIQSERERLGGDGESDLPE